MPFQTLQQPRVATMRPHAGLVVARATARGHPHGDIVLSGVQIATEPMFESAGWVYNHIGSNHW